MHQRSPNPNRTGMDSLITLLSVANTIGLIGCGLLLHKFLSPYLAEKGKNAALKEDVKQLTDQVENVKAQYAAQLESLRSSLAGEAQALERRRGAYEDMCAGLRVFVQGHGGGDPAAKERFHAAHATAWLWASDDVLTALNRYLDASVESSRQPGAVTQARLKDSYGAIMIAMRKDAGFSDTHMLAQDYQFVQFASN
jgi:hypothetical protein